MMLVCHDSAVVPTTLDEQRSTPLRIAAYGFVDKHAGSQVSASFVALERLLQNGHEVVFYAVKGFVEPRELFCYPNFRYVGIRLEKMEWGWRAIDAIFKGDLREDVRRCYSQFTVPAHRSVIRKRMRADHRARPFDAIVTFGVLSPFRLSGVATISWTQGLPHGEWDAIKRLKNQIVAQCGRKTYLRLAAYYAYRRLLFRPSLRNSDEIICGSSWTRRQFIAQGVNADRVHAVPYALDLDALTPSPVDRAARPLTFLWLGRIVPRKRLDLAVAAHQLLRREFPDARLRIIGGFSYANGYRRLIPEDASSSGIEYLAGVPREQVSGILHESDVLLQPSENEDFGTAVAEALACGVPVVVGPSNGTRDYISDDSAVFEAYTPEAVCASMTAVARRILNDPARARAAARAAAERFFAPAVVAAKVEGIVRCAVLRKRGRSRA